MYEYELVPLPDLFDLAVDHLRVVRADDAAKLLHDLSFRHCTDSSLFLLRFF